MTGTQPPGNYCYWSCRMSHPLGWAAVVQRVSFRGGGSWRSFCSGSSFPPAAACCPLAAPPSLLGLHCKCDGWVIHVKNNPPKRKKWTDTAKEVATCLAEITTSISCSGEKSEPTYRVTVLWCSLDRDAAYSLATQRRPDFVFCFIPHAQWTITSFFLSGSCCFKGKTLAGGNFERNWLCSSMQKQCKVHRH